MVEHAEIGTVITDEKALRLFRMTPVGHLRSYEMEDFGEEASIIYYIGFTDFEICDNNPYYIGVMDRKYSVYVGINRGHDYNIVLDKFITPATYNVDVKYERKDLSMMPWMNSISLIPALKRKETMKW